MDIRACVNVIVDILGKEVERKEGNGYQYFSNNKHTYRVYQKNHNLIIQCALGPKLEEDTQTSYILSELLQFNLKRMRFLDEILLLEQEDNQLFLQKTLLLDTLTPEQLKFHFEDFTLNTEVIENRFFLQQ